MYRYMTFRWPRTDSAAAKTSDYIASHLQETSRHAWRKAWEAPGITVLDSGEHKGRMQTYCLADNGGVILGRLFGNDYTSITEDLSATETTACLKSKGQHLIDNYWGRYVAFLNNSSNGAHYVMRDPSGAFPCYCTNYQGVEIYFSDMQDAADLDFLNFTINWKYLKTNLILPHFQKTHTGLNEVGEVLPAECIEITNFAQKSRFLWDPTEISQTNIIEDPQEAAAMLRETVMNATGTLAKCYDGIIHFLGGLDSSIVLACLAQTPNRPEITALTNYTKSPLGDERHYSRQVAQKYDIPLEEVELDYRRADLNRIFTINKRANPLSSLDCIDITNDELTIAAQKNAQAMFTGGGGDCVFWHMSRNFGALDYVRQHGLLGAESIRFFFEASRYGRKSIFSTARTILQERFAPAPCYPHIQKEVFGSHKRPLINPEFIGNNTFEEFLHPLLIPNDHNSKGKYLQILSSAFFNIDYYNHWDTDYYDERIHPLFTQPVVEACLRIPVWTLTYGGVDRGLARKAFMNDLPQGITRRYSKSTPLNYYEQIFEHNTEFLKELLLDGELVAHGILLRDKVEAALKGQDIFLLVSEVEILSYAALEAWVRSWLDRKEAKTKPLEIAV